MNFTIRGDALGLLTGLAGFCDCSAASKMFFAAKLFGDRLIASLAMLMAALVSPEFRANLASLTS